MIQGSATALSDIHYLEGLRKSLDADYKGLLAER